MNVELIVFATVIIAFMTAVLALLKEIRKVHVLINSRMDELLEATRKLARAEGVKEGKAEDREK